jgi:hypothetical protein
MTSVFVPLRDNREKSGAFDFSIIAGNWVGARWECKRYPLPQPDAVQAFET